MSQDRSAVARGSYPGPFVKWAGGKAQLLAQMAPFFPRRFGRFYEPFLGGGAVYFYLRPNDAVLADRNPDLINAYKVVKRAPAALMRKLDAYNARKNERSFFYEVRDGPGQNHQAPIGRAARLIFLNKTCFNGLYRVNARGKFNVPWGGYVNPKLYNRENILEVSSLLAGAELLCRDYKGAVASADEGDFVYLDPPYHPGSPTSTFTAYTRQAFGDSEQRQLASTFKDLDSRGCQVMLSNSGTSLVEELYSEFRPHRVLRAKRAINSKGTGRGPVDELLITNMR